MSTNLLPITLFPHEERHAAAHDSGMLWRAIDPQPQWVQPPVERSRGRWYGSTNAAQWPGEHSLYQICYSAFEPGALYYVQEEYADNPYFGSEGQPRRFYRNDDRAAYDTDEEWSVTNAENARTIIEVSWPGAKQARDVIPLDHLSLGIEFSYVGNDQKELRARRFFQLYGAQPETWGFLYRYTVKERRS